MKRVLSLTALLILWFQVVYADGIIIPEPPQVPLAIKYHRVKVEITDQATVTSIDQVFLNEEGIDVEGTYIFPIPEGASISEFSMYVDGTKLDGAVLDADEARNIYEEIVRRRIDPALLEYMGRGLYRARVFPIPANGERRVELSYDEILLSEGGICRYVYPLSTEKFSSKPLEDVSVEVELFSSDPIKSIYSPSHDIVVEKHDDFSATIRYGDENIIPDTDFVLYYTVSRDDVGINLLTYREPEEGGFYILLASPKVEVEETEVVSKRALFVIDTSGSMDGPKIDQAKGALKFVLNNLNQGDEFNVVDYSTGVNSFSKFPVEASSENISSAISYVDRLSAVGATNINGALLTALGMMRDDGLTNIILFLTDGMPTIEVTDENEILANVDAANNAESRMFVFGVGNDVNTHLLDHLSERSRGASTYVRPEEDIEIAVSSLYKKISNPVLSNLSLDFGSIEVWDNYPGELPDLFEGSQVVQLGRYTGSGGTTVRLSGLANDVLKEFMADFVFPDESLDSEFIPRLWATRKVGYLLDQIRLNGEHQEIVDQIIALSKLYGIITPYTSFLIVEDEPSEPMFDDSFWAESGEGAVDASNEVRDYKSSDNIDDVRSGGVKYVGSKTFFMRDGFWQDSKYVEDQPTVDYRYGSDAYFSLLTGKPELGRYLAIGKNLIVSFDQTNYRIGENISETGTEGESPNIPKEFRLEQNYPNPFNPWTEISYELSGKMRVKLTIYNVLGREVATLVDDVQPAGSHSAIWNAKGFPSGVYIYKLRSGDLAQVKKMVLMR